MNMLKSQLPPLEPLVAFEAAARLLSFTRAAGELSLTQAAISQQIRSLESRLGIKLFIRAHRSVRLTAAGLAYQHTVSTLLNHLASATDDIKSESTVNRISVAADQSIASMWLVPRLLQFRRAHPSISLRLVVSDVDADCTADDIQIAIIHGEGDWPGYTATRLFDEEVFPVCSSGFAGQSKFPCAVEQLVNESLLDLEDFHWNWMNWRNWLSSSGVDLPAKRPSLQINSYPLLIEAAKSGMGIALGWRTLVDDDITVGALIVPVTESLFTGQGYYLLRRDHSAGRPEIDVFCNWVRVFFE